MRYLLLILIVTQVSCGRRPCGAPFSDDCVVTKHGCQDPNPSGCEGGGSLADIRQNLAIRRGWEPEAGIVCWPILIAPCDDPRYFVYGRWGPDSAGSKQVNHVDGGCVGAYVSSASDTGLPDNEVCLDSGEPVWTGDPALEACMAQVDRFWSENSEACDFYGSERCDPERCYVDLTQ